MPETFATLFTDHVLHSFDKQLHFADLHGRHAWDFQLSEGTITFARTISYRIQVLGTEDNVSRTWLWGWANDASPIPADLLIAAEQLREFGDEHSISELTVPQQPLDRLDGHNVGLIACGFADAQAYYRCPYHNGALYVLISDSSLYLPTDSEPLRVQSVITQCLSAFSIEDQPRAIASYLRQKNYSVSESVNMLNVYRSSMEIMEIEFDHQGRIIEMEMKISV